MVELIEIRNAVSEHFGSVVTVKKLKDPCGSKTVRQAKAAAVYIARSDGHDNDKIAKTFGYSSGKSVSNLFSRLNKEIGGDPYLEHDIKTIADKLSIDLV